MSHGAYAAYTKTMASAGTLTGAFDLAKAWNNVYLVIPSMTSNTAICIQASDSLTGTYRRLKQPVINTATSTILDFAISSAATNCIVPIPTGLQYLKVESTTTVDNGALFTVICGD